MSGRPRIRAKLLCGGAAKNRLTGTDSPAFRKANHDAMEAIKTSVAKLKAERERFSREDDRDRE